MSSPKRGRQLAGLLLLAFACNGEFRFDTGPRANDDIGNAGTAALPPAGSGGNPASAGTGNGTASSSGAPSGSGATASAGATSGTGAIAAGGDSDAGSGSVGELDCGRCAQFGLVCSDDDGGDCVECRKDEDCPSANPYCDLGAHRCTPCTATEGCEKGTVCDRWSYACLPSCASEVDPDHDCSRSTHMCDMDRYVCVECRSDADCSCNPHGTHCVHSTRCAECAVDADCGMLGRFCDQISFTCVVCRDSHDCGFPLVCDPSTHTCVGDEYHGGN